MDSSEPLGNDEIEYTQGSAARHEFQSLRYSGMRFMIRVAFMPCPIACNIHPICHQPDFTRHILWAEDIHPDKTGGTVDKMRTANESLLDLGIHVISHDEPAQDANRLLFQTQQLLPKELLLSVYATGSSKRGDFSLGVAIGDDRLCTSSPNRR